MALGGNLPGAYTSREALLEAALEATGDAVKGVEVKNDPPKIIFATKPSVLVLIDGQPQLRATNLAVLFSAAGNITL